MEGHAAAGTPTNEVASPVDGPLGEYHSDSDYEDGGGSADDEEESGHLPLLDRNPEEVSEEAARHQMAGVTLASALGIGDREEQPALANEADVEDWCAWASLHPTTSKFIDRALGKRGCRIVYESKCKKVRRLFKFYMDNPDNSDVK